MRSPRRTQSTVAVAVVSSLCTVQAQEREGAEALRAQRQELLQRADAALEQLRSRDPSAAESLDHAYGHAVFSATKAGLLVTGAGGTGVARAADLGQPIFMHVGAAGIGVGGGVESYRMVLVFEDPGTYMEFVSGQWDASISAQAAAGFGGAAAEEPFANGVRIYRLTDAGLIAQIEISGMRFWASDSLNDDF